MKKQITIDGEKSDWYEKAIFILKDSKQPHIPDNLFLYAEDIVESHLKKNPMIRAYQSKEKKHFHKKKDTQMARKIDQFFNVSLIVCGVSVIVLIAILLT